MVDAEFHSCHSDTLSSGVANGRFVKHVRRASALEQIDDLMGCVSEAGRRRVAQLPGQDGIAVSDQVRENLMGLSVIEILQRGRARARVTYMEAIPAADPDHSPFGEAIAQLGWLTKSKELFLNVHDNVAKHIHGSAGKRSQLPRLPPCCLSA